MVWIKIIALVVVYLVLYAPAWAAGDSGLLRQAGQAPGVGVMRDASGNRTGTVERQSDGSRVIRDKSGRRTGTIEQGAGGRQVIRDAEGRSIGTVEGR